MKFNVKPALVLVLYLVIPGIVFDRCSLKRDIVVHVMKVETVTN